jgi:hypothetical protein
MVMRLEASEGALEAVPWCPVSNWNRQTKESVSWLT